MKRNFSDLIKRMLKMRKHIIVVTDNKDAQKEMKQDPTFDGVMFVDNLTPDIVDGQEPYTSYVIELTHRDKSINLDVIEYDDYTVFIPIHYERIP